MEAFRAGADWLSERYEVVHRPDIFDRRGYFAGDDDRRLGELLEALADPAVDALICARGGYGTTRLLPGIDLAAVRDANKTLVGFSDITALHAIWAQAGVRSIHAPMVAALGKADARIRELWIDALECPDKTRRWNLCPLVEGEASGLLAGGNLAVLGALLGTPYQPDFTGRILFLEDVGERPYRIDRVLTSLRQAGAFDGLAGLVLGSFTEGDPGADGVTVEEVFADHFLGASFPVVTGFPAGHIDENEPVPLGARAILSGGVLQCGVSGDAVRT